MGKKKKKIKEQTKKYGRRKGEGDKNRTKIWGREEDGGGRRWRRKKKRRSVTN